MPRRGLGRPTFDIRYRREGRVHQDDARAQACVEMIVDLRGIKASDWAAREQKAQKVGAGVGQFVQNEAGACDLGEDRQKPGPGRRLENQVTGVYPRCRQGCETHGEGR